VALLPIKSIDPSTLDPSPENPRLYGQKLIGRGSQSRVYIAEYDNDIRAVKVYPLGFANVRHLIDFRTEARIMLTIMDPNIVHVYGAIVNEHSPAIVMDYCALGPLDNLIPKMNLAQRLWALRCIARGLSVVHSHLISHRDLKPANVFVDRGGKALLGDFGMAKILSEGTGQTKSAMVGTVKFMAPEVARGKCGGLGWLQADMWSFGITCYNVLSGGSYPFSDSGDALTADLITLKNLKIQPIPNVPAEVSALMARCLQVDPAARPTAQEAIKILKVFPESPIHA